MTRVLDTAKGVRMPDSKQLPPDFPGRPSREMRGSDPWSDETWGNGGLNNVTFETVETDVFEFTAEDTRKHADSPDDVELSLFRGVSKAAKREVYQEKRIAGPPIVAVNINECLSAIYDDVSEEPSCQVEGSIFVTPTVDMSRHSFCLVVRDLLGHIDVLEDRTGVAKDITTQITRKGLHRSDRVLRISLPATATRKEVRIARYICSGRLRPVPLVSCAFHIVRRMSMNIACVSRCATP